MGMGKKKQMTSRTEFFEQQVRESGYKKEEVNSVYYADDTIYNKDIYGASNRFVMMTRK
jgi:hypothetical protein